MALILVAVLIVVVIFTDEGGGTIAIAITLKKGWNTVLMTQSETSITATSGTPDSSYKWQIIDRDGYYDED